MMFSKFFITKMHDLLQLFVLTNDLLFGIRTFNVKFKNPFEK